MRIGTFITAAAALCLMNAATAQAPGPGTPAATGPVPTTFVVKFKIKPGKNAQFEKAMAKIQAALVTSEPGNLYYDLYLPTPDSQTYVLIEHYRNAAAVTAHGKDPNTQQMVSDIKDLLDGPTAQAISAERLILVSSKP
ncbi:MAG TPA: putative quinol monooxygenase [Steroidobacteraceae bacterium]|nr:putative quinol monooxygenase [Steroidobacteraceae bacterium]